MKVIKNSIDKERYVIRVFDPFSTTFRYVYYYNTNRSHCINILLTEREIDFARTHSYKQRWAAERGMEILRKRFVVPWREVVEHKDYESLGYRRLVAKLAAGYNLEKCPYLLSIITLDEMFDEIEKEYIRREWKV